MNEKNIDRTINAVNTIYSGGKRLTNIFMGLFFFAVGLCILVFGINWLVNRVSTLKDYTITTGTVSEMKEQKDSQADGYLYAPVVTFTDAKGNERKYYSSNFGYPPPYSVGDKVEIYYKGTSSDDVFINSFMEKWMTAIILIPLGIIFVPLGFWLVISGFRRRKNFTQSTQDINSDKNSYISIG